MHIWRNYLLSTILASLLMAVNPVKKVIDDGEFNVSDSDDLHIPSSIIDLLKMSLHDTTEVTED